MHEAQTAVRPHRAFKTAGVQSCLFGSVNHGVVRGSHGDEAAKLQSVEYVKANRFPGNQSLIQKYLPIAQKVFRQTYEQLQQQEAE